MGPHNAMAAIEVVLLLVEVHASPKALCGTIDTPQQLCHDLPHLRSHGSCKDCLHLRAMEDPDIIKTT